METQASTASAPHGCLSSLWLPGRHIVELLSPEATSHTKSRYISVHSSLCTYYAPALCVCAPAVSPRPSKYSTGVSFACVLVCSYTGLNGFTVKQHNPFSRLLLLLVVGLSGG